MTTPLHPPLPRLSEREVTIIEMAMRGMTSNAIGADLFLSPKTIKAHKSHVFAKMGAKSMAHAVAIYLGAVPVEPHSIQHNAENGGETTQDADYLPQAVDL